MNAGGWFILILSVGSVTALFGWCIYKVITSPVDGDMHGFEIETPDEKAQRLSDEQHL